MGLLNWEISTFPRLSKMECAQLKQVLHIIPALKFGKAKNMDVNVIFGPLVVFFMNCALFTLLSKQGISQNYIEK